MVLDLSFNGCENIVSIYAVFWCCIVFVDAISLVTSVMCSCNHLFCETLIYKLLVWKRLNLAKPWRNLILFSLAYMNGCSTGYVMVSRNRETLCFSPQK